MAINDQFKALEASMERSQALAEKFAEAADKTTGKAQAAARTMSLMFDKMSKQQAELLLGEKKIADLNAERIKMTERLKKAQDGSLKMSKKDQDNLEAKLKLTRETYREQVIAVQKAKEETKAIQDQLSALTEKKSVWGEITKNISESKKQLIGYLGSTAALLNGLRGIAQAAQDVADIQIQNGSFLGMSGDITKDFIEGGAAALKWSSNMSAAKITLVGLGISAEEAGYAFKEFSVVTQDASRQRAMTEATGALSRMLGVSLTESTEYVIEQTQKYNRTAESSAAVMMDLYNNTRKMNDGMGMTVLRGRDVAKLLFDISRESRAVAQDQKMMQQFISQNMVGLQAQGRNYREALQSVSGYVKKMTVDAPDWAKILSSRQLGKQLQELGKGTKIGEELESELEKSSPGLVKRIKDLQAQVNSGAVDSLTADRTMQEWLSETRVGMDSMQEEVGKVINRLGPKAAVALSEMYGTSLSEAVDMVNMNKQWQEQKNMAKQVAMNTKESWAEVEAKIGNLSDSEKNMLATKLTGAEREEFIRSRMMAKEKDALKAAKTAQEESRNKQIEQLEQRIAQAKSENDTTTVDYLSDQLREIQDKNNKQLTNVTKGIQDQVSVLQKWLGGGFVKQIGEILSSPLMQIAGGIAGLAVMVLHQRTANTLLRQIVANTGRVGGGSGGPEGKGGGILDRIKRSGGKIGRAAGAVGKVLSKIPGKKALGGIAGSLGLSALLNAGDIKEAFQQGGLGGGLKSLLANSAGKTGIGGLIGTGIGMAIPVPGAAFVGGMAGEFLGDALGLGDVNSLLGVDASAVGKGNSVSNSPVADTSGMAAGAAGAAQANQSVMGSPNVKAGSGPGSWIQKDGGYFWRQVLEVPISQGVGLTEQMATQYGGMA